MFKISTQTELRLGYGIHQCSEDLLFSSCYPNSKDVASQSITVLFLVLFMMTFGIIFRVVTLVGFRRDFFTGSSSGCGGGCCRRF